MFVYITGDVQHAPFFEENCLSNDLCIDVVVFISKSLRL